MKDDLALRALATPSVEAPDALEVLMDVLLEAGILSDESDDLRRRAFQWAKRRHAPLPSPMQQLVALVLEALDERSGTPMPAFPHAVVGVVGPFNVRIHFLATVGPDLRLIAREAVVRRLPVPVVIDVTCLDR